MLEQYGGLPILRRSHGLKHPYSLRQDEVTAAPPFPGIERWIYLVRDPRDVIVSSYFERTRRGQFWSELFTFDYSYNGMLTDYLREERGSFTTLLAFMDCWAEFALKHPKRCLILRYEDILEDASRELNRILTYMRAPIDEARVGYAVDVSAFENMRKLELVQRGDVQLARKSGLVGSRSLTPGNPFDGESYKVRRGKHGGYTDYLDNDDITYMNRSIAAKPRIMGHPINYSMFLSQFSKGHDENS
jgi:hypothetical protein